MTATGPAGVSTAEEARLRAEVARLRDAWGAFTLSDEGDFTWLVYEHTDGTRCAVAQVDCPAVLETLRAVLGGVADEPTGDNP